MNIILYKSNAEKNRMYKNSYLTQVANLTGNLRDGSSIIDPVIQIRGGASFFVANYMYIEEFNRYYFITDISVEHTMDIIISAHVDVLMSWNTEIVGNQALVTRSSNKGNAYLQDKFNRALPTFSIERGSETEPIFSLSLKNYNENVSARNIVLFVRNNVIKDTSVEGTDRGNCLQKPATGCAMPFFGGIVYIVDVRAIQTIISNYGSDAGIMSSIIKAIAFPFDVVSFLSTIGQPGLVLQKVDGIKLTDYNDGTDVSILPASQFFVINYDSSLLCDLSEYLSKDNVTFTNSYLDYEPYSEYYIHLPMYGDVKVSAEILNMESIKLYGVFDIWNGTITYSLFVNDGESVANGAYKNIFTEQAMVGSQLLFAYDNADIMNKDYTSLQANNYVKAMSGLATMIAGGIVTLTNIPAGLGIMLAGAGQGLSGVVSIATADVLPKSSMAGVNGNNVGTYNTYVDCGLYMYHIKYDSIFEQGNGDYANIIGYPADDIETISNCTGYLEVGTCHLDNVPATSTELDEILQLLQSGVLMS